MNGKVTIKKRDEKHLAYNKNKIYFKMAIYLKITNPTEVVKKKTSKWLTDITPERIDRKLVEDEVIKGIIEQLTLEGIKGEISAINGFEVKESSVITKNNFVIRKTKTF